MCTINTIQISEPPKVISFQEFETAPLQTIDKFEPTIKNTVQNVDTLPNIPSQT